MKIRTAILGYGRSGSTMHAGAIEHSDAFEMTAVCDIDPARREEAANRFGCPVHDDYHQMLASEKLDLVCVVTRSDQHCEMACDCLESGVNVLVTKPWAVNAAEAERMIATAGNTSMKLLPWLPARWGSDVRRLRALMDEAAIGKPFLIRRVVTSFGTRCDWQTESRHGGGYLLNWGPHIVDPPLLLVDSKPVSVYAQMRQTINPGDVEDVFIALIVLENGAIVQVEFTISVEKMPTWIVQGDRGTIRVRGANLTMFKCDPAKPEDPTVFSTMQSDDGGPVEETLEGDIYGDTNEVYACIAAEMLGEGEYPVKPADALRLTKILDAIGTSSKENRVVSLV